MVELTGILKTLKIIEKKGAANGEKKASKKMCVTLEVDYDDVTDAEYGNIALTQANGDPVAITLGVKQLLIDFPDGVMPINENSEGDTD